MTISQTSFLADVISSIKSIPQGTRAYFQERQRSKLYALIIKGFLEKEKKGELSRALLARRINKKPEQITRWLSTPGNWTLDTISDLTLAIFGGELVFSVSSFAQMPPRNSSTFEVLKTRISEKKHISRTLPTSAQSSSYKNQSWELKDAA